MQTWVANDGFLYCHLIAESEDGVFLATKCIWHLRKSRWLNGKQMFQIISTYRAQNQILQQHPEKDDDWRFHYPDFNSENNPQLNWAFFWPCDSSQR